mmetsp:Transcript_40863/g.102910  ORF Transcript_40863/g.102910 Transcript_40863/m.102910 type:complete len:114 (-) Transcript_40863:8-349(-)
MNRYSGYPNHIVLNVKRQFPLVNVPHHRCTALCLRVGGWHHLRCSQGGQQRRSRVGGMAQLNQQEGGHKDNKKTRRDTHSPPFGSLRYIYISLSLSLYLYLSHEVYSALQWHG